MKPRDSSDADVAALEALCGRLAGFDARIGLEWLDGCMAALIAGPRRPPFDEWIERLLGDAWTRTFADPDDLQQASATLQRRWAVLVSQLDVDALYDAPDELRLGPLLADYSDAARDALLASGDLGDVADWPLTGEMWAQGVLEAVDAFADDWPEPHADDEDAQWFGANVRRIALLTLNDAAERDVALAQLFPDKTLSRDELVDEACFALQDLRMYWVENAPKHAPRSVPVTPGRNDPCPCGSGRKYKKCHGAA
jgi:uncharacterized protein